MSLILLWSSVKRQHRIRWEPGATVKRKVGIWWDGRMASPTQWMWVWANSKRWWRTGKPGVLQSVVSQSQTPLSNWTTKTGPLPYAVPQPICVCISTQRCPRVYTHTHTHICGLLQEISKKSRSSVGHTADCMECITGSTSCVPFIVRAPLSFCEKSMECVNCVCVFIYPPFYMHVCRVWAYTVILLNALTGGCPNEWSHLQSTVLGVLWPPLELSPGLLFSNDRSYIWWGL